MSKGPGSVTVLTGDQDPDQSNDRALITVGAPGSNGGDSNGGGGSTGGGNSNGGGGSTGGGGSSGGGNGGGLPVTGAPAMLIAMVGALLMAAGGVASVAARRRRIRTVIED